MLDAFGTLAFSLLVGASAVFIASGRAYRGADLVHDRLTRWGTRRPPNAPSGDAPEAIVARLKTRERAALIGSSGAVLVAIASLFPHEPTLDAYLVYLAAAILGRAAVLGVLGARDAWAPTAGPRVSRGARVGLADYVPRWAVPVLLASQLAFSVVAVLVAGPYRGRVTVVLVVALTVAIGADLIAARLAASSMAAASTAELGWADALRAEDIGQLLLVGPLAAGVVLGVPLPQRWPLAAGYVVALLGGALLVARAARCVVRVRHHQEWSVDAHR